MLMSAAPQMKSVTTWVEFHDSETFHHWTVCCGDDSNCFEEVHGH
jgi:hypothetical protein